MLKSLWGQPVGQRKQTGSQKYKDRNPGGLDLVRCDQRVALFLGFHFSEVSPSTDEPRTFGGIVWRTGLRFERLIAQVADVAAHGANQVILPPLSLGDYALAAQLLDPSFREIQKPCDDADGLGRC